ncbi:MAG: arginine--tRNA ligase [Verrucomicrobia bacterium]|nr:arginine--tRNA ligase [Verrucomicrobiota bacterium]
MKNRTIEEDLSNWIRKAFETAFPGLIPENAPVEVVATANEEFGDYQCNAAMGLSKPLRKNPREIARAALDSCSLPDEISRAEIAGPGFINVFLSEGYLAEALRGMQEDDRLGVRSVGEGKTVIMDYSSPNVAKPMHIGHIRSTGIGNALDRLHRFLGYRVIADNHLGDWGTQFGLLIMGYRHFVDEKALLDHPVEELERIYVQSYQKSEEDPSWRDEAKKELVKLQQGDEENLALWKRFIELSLKEFSSIYERLGVTFDLYRGESYYNDRLPSLVEELKEKNLAVTSEGAQVVFLEEEKLPVCIVQKSDGGFNYATTDLATLESRIEEFDPDKIIYLTDERQQLHFKQIFAVASRLGWRADLAHVWFGLMRLKEGTFSTRQGNVIKLEQLMDEAESRAFEVVKVSSPDMPEAQQRDVAKSVGIGAVKYADLSQNPQSVVTFTWEKALALDGNSAPYLQYAYARIASVQDKYTERFPKSDLRAFPIRIEHELERRLAIRLLRFADTLFRAAEFYRPNLIADYLYDLAQVYSTFYQNVPFLKAEEGVRESRVQICGLVARTLKKGLDLLGIETPERI